MSMTRDEIWELALGDKVTIWITGMTGSYVAEVSDVAGTAHHPGPWLNCKRMTMNGKFISLKGEDFIVLRRATADDITYADENGVIHLPAVV